MDKKYDYLKIYTNIAGKIAIGIATPSAIIGIIAVFFAFKFPDGIYYNFDSRSDSCYR